MEIPTYVYTYLSITTSIYTSYIYLSVMSVHRFTGKIYG